MNVRRLNVLIFYSSCPGAFCSGADLVERKSMFDDQIRDFLSNIRLVFNCIDNLPFPTIAAIDGPALGGGIQFGAGMESR